MRRHRVAVTNALLRSDADAYALNALALVSAILCALIPWNKLHRRALHLLGVIATAEVTVAVVVHAQYATVFMWYFVLVAVFAAYAFRRRREAIAQIAGVVTGWSPPPCMRTGSTRTRWPTPSWPSRPSASTPGS